MNDGQRFWKKIIHARSFQYILAGIRIALGAMFFYAGIIKIADPAGFSLAVYNYQILPHWLVNITAIILPWVEVTSGICLVLGIWTSGSALIITGLLFVFTLALGFNLARGLNIACGCFTTSPAAEKIAWWYLLRDFSLLAAGLLILFTDQGLCSLERVCHGKLEHKS